MNCSIFSRIAQVARDASLVDKQEDDVQTSSVHFMFHLEPLAHALS
jgi:hypothetical protein